jgi:hypothetical protein
VSRLEVEMSGLAGCRSERDRLGHGVRLDEGHVPEEAASADLQAVGDDFASDEDPLEAEVRRPVPQTKAALD